MKKITTFFFFLFIINFSFGQIDSFVQYINFYDSLNINNAREKIFIHYDKPYYAIKDTMWLKGYILTADLNKPSDSSGIVYVEIINEEKEVVKRISAPCFSGTFFSNITFHERIFPQGDYSIRAYTNNMRNYGDSLFYESTFKIVDMLADEWNASVRNINFTKDTFSLLTLLKDATQVPMRDKRVAVRIKSKNRNVFRLNTMTDNNGYIKIDTLLNIADKNNLSLEIADRGTTKLKIPLYINGKEQIDVQFFPEGGKLIAGKKQKLGFKAIDVYGKGVDVSGAIKDSKGNTVAYFSSLYKGMGVVEFIPLPNEMYTAHTNAEQIVDLPQVYEKGTLLQVVDTPTSDSIKVIVDADNYNSSYFFSASAKGITWAIGRVVLKGSANVLAFSKKNIPSGITRFTLYNTQMHPLNERIIFVKNDDDLKIEIQPHKEVYATKDSVSVAIHVKNAKDENVLGSFSLAVIDTAQIKINKNAENIISYMLLQSDLKGNIENPFYYFTNATAQETDALMLTQGWVNYNWIFPAEKFVAEKTFTISGRVSDVFNKSMPGVNVLVFGKSGDNSAVVLDTLTDKQGQFLFNQFPVFEDENVSMLIRALNKRNKSFNVGIDLNEPEYPPYNRELTAVPGKSIILDTVIRKYIADQDKIAEQMQNDKEYLGEVVVTTTARIQGSKNLNRDGGSDQLIGEFDMRGMDKESLLQVLYRTVDGFTRGTRPKTFVSIYKINNMEVNFIIDGIELKWFYNSVSNSPDEYIQFLDSYLNYISGENVKGMEVMKSSKYKSPYSSKFLNPRQNDWDISFIEITTKTGEGPFLKKTPGIYLYKPLAPFIGKEFYSPRYAVKDETTLPDFRSTIYWNPHVITDTTGRATVSFYTSDSKGGYMIIMQGTDLNGSLGVQFSELKIEDD